MPRRGGHSAVAATTCRRRRGIDQDAARTNEIPCFRTVLDQVFDLDGVVISADAMHAQTGHLQYLRGRGAHLLVRVKANQPTLLARLKALPWKDIPIGHTSTGRGHGRIEKRTLKVVTVTESAGGLGFPDAAQAIQVVRRTRRITPQPGRKDSWRTETVYAIVTLPAEHATAPAVARDLQERAGESIKRSKVVTNEVARVRSDSQRGLETFWTSSLSSSVRRRQ
jgi:hypothetical protein